MAQSNELAALQAHLRQIGAQWQAGPTTLSGLSPLQLQARLGALPPPGTPTMQEREQAAQAKYAALVRTPEIVPAYPATFDMRYVRGSNYITPIEDQGNCGSCVAFATTATVEALFQFHYGNPNRGMDLSEAHLWYCFAEQNDGRICGAGDPKKIGVVA